MEFMDDTEILLWIISNMRLTEARDMIDSEDTPPAVRQMIMAVTCLKKL